SMLIIIFQLVVAAPPQLFNTSLTVTVRDETGNTVAGAFVKLFENEESYNQEKNAVAEGTADAKGVFRFKKLKPIAYFILVKKDDKDNSGGGEKIGKLEEGKFNKVTVVIQ
ncbi:MAG: carboxypeptidase-like regulatory domain-containing protein, partial [Cytophagales bacterium]